MGLAKQLEVTTTDLSKSQKGSKESAMSKHIEFTEKALNAIDFMFATGNIADAKRYVFALIESGIQRTEAQEARLNALFAACYN